MPASVTPPQSEYRAVRKLMVTAILSTDMSVHKDLLARVMLRATRVAVRGAGAGGFSRSSSDDRSLLVSFLLHTADLCVRGAAHCMWLCERHPLQRNAADGQYRRP
jgi:hypothetical protein